MEEFFDGILAKLGEWIISFGGKLLLGLVVLLVGLKLAKWLANRMIKAKAFSKNADVRSFFKSGLTFVLYALVIITTITIWGVPTASIVAVLASCGLAVGLALQGSLSNFAGGLMILLFHPFHVGDYIDNGTYQGTVEEIGIFYTTAITVDNRKVVFPNSTVSNSALINVTAKDLRRVDLAFEVDVNAESSKVIAALTESAKACPLTISEPEPFAAITEVRGGCAIYTFRTWVKTTDYWDAYFALQSGATKALAQNGIEISFPKTGVAVK